MTPQNPPAGLKAPDGVSVARWFAFYLLLLAAAAAGLGVLLARQDHGWSQWIHQTAAVFKDTNPAIKLLAFGIYLSLCCTFLPLPTGWLVAGVATRQAAVAAGMVPAGNELAVALATTALVGAVGGVGSMLANLNDYHLFTWMLRHHRVGRVRNTRLFHASARWFSRAPFAIVVIFNLIPIPVDVVRMLAATYRYARLPFAAANFVGRFLRYAVIAFVTYWWNLGWIAVAALLALAVALASVKAASMSLSKFRRARPAAADNARQ